MKKEIIRKHDGGMRVTDLSKEYGRNPSTIGTILKMREKILVTDAAKGVTRIVKNRPAVLEEVEKLLLIWLEEKQRAGDKVTEAIICEKAKALHADLVREQPGTSGEPEVFKASRGWFDRFKTRSGIHSLGTLGNPRGSSSAVQSSSSSHYLRLNQPRANNDIADALSRFQMELFRSLALEGQQLLGYFLEQFGTLATDSPARSPPTPHVRIVRHSIVHWDSKRVVESGFGHRLRIPNHVYVS
uniref:tigger transposable element-derived protein 1-like n=1 Tax=Podarcis muralis TaxID=64176 RepID=UPI0010A075E3